MQYLGHKAVNRPDSTFDDGWQKYTCGHCGTMVTGAVYACHSDQKWLACTNCGKGSFMDELGNVYPGTPFGPTVEGVPDEVYDAYNEARRNISINSYHSAELICRKILMHIAVEKGADEGKTFAAYLDFLLKEDYITKHMKNWADKIRQIGNAATHKIEPPDRDRAKSAVLFTAELLRIVYEMNHFANLY